ncbi:filamentous hemagglutinin N-terminal domain-containing protein [uncultured Ramlibacter sp.]|uniref:two-partner secretion domain-containing protein n=1 Tax=uncultured Ramlibacter sp. TaxID=260755 RepID=UPI00262988E5|nr:filamentous hemagglutinin N-terminal domain-containing protein [uncultured Ramlibacter sp.]
MHTSNALTLRRTIAAIALACSGAALAQLPTAPTVVHGQASVQRAGNVLTITNTPGAILHWQGFSVGAGETARFNQQSAASSVLNRVTGQDPSLILGSLQSNGKVFLLNPNGVLFGAGSRVDVNGLVASSLAMTNADFLAGRLNFSGNGSEGRVASQGEIRTPQGGRILLIAPQVDNSGLLHAPGGEVVLAAGRSVRLADSSNPDLHVVVSAPQDQALNLGQIVAGGGNVGIYGGLVSQRGLVNADSAVLGAGGKIVFKASGDLLLEAGSKTSATGDSKGGSIHLLGERVALRGNAQVDASGRSGGGTVLAGGDYQGGNPAIANAQQLRVGSEASIKADAIDSGDGGKVIAWSDGGTRMHGSISARGGAASGDGGFVEVSGRTLDMQGLVDTRAPQGRPGQLLLDPTNIYIAADQATATGAGMEGSVGTEAFDPGQFGPVETERDSLLLVSTLASALATNAAVTVNTANTNATGAGIIYVLSPVMIPEEKRLTLSASAGIQLKARISSLNYSELILRTATGDIVQTAAFSVYSLAAHATTGSVDLRHADNNVFQVAGSSGGANGFKFRAAGVNIGSLPGEGGITATGTGPIDVQAGSLTIRSDVTSAAGEVVLKADTTMTNNAIVSSTSGDVTLKANTTMTNNSIVSSTSGRVTVQDVVLRPSLADCIATAGLAGCGAVLPTLLACQAAPATPGCSVVLPPPTLGACIAAPATPGCTAVLPSIAQCVTTPALAGCTVVLPSLAVCRVTPATAGCTHVLEQQAAADAAAAAAAAAAQAAAEAAAQAVAQAAAQAAARAAAEAAAKAAADAALRAAAEAAARAAAEKAATEAAAKAAALAAAETAARAAMEAAVKAAMEAAVKAAAEAAAAAAQGGQAGSNEPVAQALNSTVNIINTTATSGSNATPGVGTGSAEKISSPATAKEGKTVEKKGDLVTQKSDVKKEDVAKKMYCN